MHGKARLHVTQVVSGLDLSGSQSDGGTTADAVEGDFPGMDKDVIQAVHQERAPGVHCHGGIVGHCPEVLQLCHQG